MSDRSIYLLSTGIIPAHLIGEAEGNHLLLDVKPYIAVEPLAAEGLEELAMRRLVALFTSVHAVDVVVGKGLRPAGWKIYCIAGATCERVAAALGEAVIAGKADSAADLAELIREREPEKELFFFCGDRRREELPLMLERGGWKLIEKIVYRTVLTPQTVQRNYDGIAFFSPSAVESYFSVNAAARETVMFAIGPSTSAGIRARCSNPVITGTRPDKEWLIRKMIEYFNHQ